MTIKGADLGRLEKSLADLKSKSYWDRSLADIVAIADKIGSSSRYVLELAKERGVDIPSWPAIKKRAAIEEVRGIAFNDRTPKLLAEIAGRHGVSASTIKNGCHEAKPPVALPKYKKNQGVMFVRNSTLEIVARLIERELTGESYEMIGDEFKLTRQRVKQIEESARKAGVFIAVGRVAKQRARDAGSERAAG